MATKAKIQIPKGIHFGAYAVPCPYVSNVGSGHSGGLVNSPMFTGWIENKRRTWILYVRADGSGVLYTKRDPKTGECSNDGAVYLDAPEHGKT